MRLNKFIQRVDISRYMATHLVGNNHTQTHRQISGIAIMMFGVGISYLLRIPPSAVFHFTGELIGFAFHGIGLIPFIKNMESTADKIIRNEPNNRGAITVGSDGTDTGPHIPPNH